MTYFQGWTIIAILVTGMYVYSMNQREAGPSALQQHHDFMDRFTKGKNP